MENLLSMKDIEKRLSEQNSKIKLGGSSEMALIMLSEIDDMSLEGMITSLYNKAKISQKHIEKLESNLLLLTTRVYAIKEEDFSDEEVEEIEIALKYLEIEQLRDLKIT